MSDVKSFSHKGGEGESLAAFSLSCSRPCIREKSEVDLGVKYTDEGRKVLDETTLLWQNVVKSKRLPIEHGKTYEVEDYAPDGTAKAEVVLKRVVFEDGTYWNAQ